MTAKLSVANYYKYRRWYTDTPDIARLLTGWGVTAECLAATHLFDQRFNFFRQRKPPGSIA
jgi:hypothetical protein